MKSKNLIMVGLPMIAVAYGFARFSYGLVLPYIRDSLGMSQSAAGVISSLSYLAYCFAIVLAMIYMSKVGARAIILIAGAAAIVGMSIIAISNSVITLGVGIFIAGISTGLASPPYADVVNNWINKDERPQTNTWVNSGTSLGTALTGLIVIFLGSNWRLTYILFTLIAIITLYLNYKYIPKKKETTKNEGEQSLNLKKTNRGNAYPLIIASLLLGISMTAYWTFSGDLLAQTEGLPASLSQLFWIIIGISGFAGGFAGSISNKIGLTSSYRFGVIVISFASIILGLSTTVLPIVISAIFFGSSYIFIAGILILWGIEMFDINPAFGLGLSYLILTIGQLLGAFAGGFLAESLGYPAVFILYGLIGLAALVVNPKKSFQSYKTEEHIEENI